MEKGEQHFRQWSILTAVRLKGRTPKPSAEYRTRRFSEYPFKTIKNLRVVVINEDGNIEDGWLGLSEVTRTKCASLTRKGRHVPSQGGTWLVSSSYRSEPCGRTADSDPKGMERQRTDERKEISTIFWNATTKLKIWWKSWKTGFLNIYDILDHVDGSL